MLKSVCRRMCFRGGKKGYLISVHNHLQLLHLGRSREVATPHRNNVRLFSCNNIENDIFDGVLVTRKYMWILFKVSVSFFSLSFYCGQNYWNAIILLAGLAWRPLNWLRIAQCYFVLKSRMLLWRGAGFFVTQRADSEGLSRFQRNFI